MELGVGFDTLEIGVQDQLPERVHLHVAQQDLAGRGIDFHVQDGGMERFLLQGMPQRVVVHLDLLGLAGASINDARRSPGDAKTAARTRPLLCALKCDEFHDSLQKESTATSVTPVDKSRHRAELPHAAHFAPIR